MPAQRTTPSQAAPDPRIRCLLSAATLLTAALPASAMVTEAEAAPAPTGGCAVQPYRQAPDATLSTSYGLRADGRSVAVTAYKDVDYAQFAFCESVTVTVSRLNGAGLSDATLQPARRDLGAAVDGSTLTYTLTRPGKFVLEIPGGRKLFLFAKRPDAVPNGPAVHDVRDFGVTTDGRAVATNTIQQAIDTVGEHGGVLFFPAGTYRTGTLRMRSGVTLHLADGALIQGTRNPADYPVDPGWEESDSYGEHFTFSRLIHFDGVHNAGITGRGVIDGDGKALRQAGRNSNLIRIADSRNIDISGVVLRDSAAWNTHVLGSTNVRIADVEVINDLTNPNTDGIDVDGSVNVRTDDTFQYVGDDALVVKATNNSGLLDNARNITFTGNVLYTLKSAMKLGTESLASKFTGIRFEDNDVLAADRAMGLVINDGATYRNIRFSDIRVQNTAHLFEQNIGLRKGYDRTPGRIDGVTFARVTAVGYHPKNNKTTNNKTEWAFHGFDEDHQVSRLTFDHVVVNGSLLTDAETAWKEAMLNFGPYVDQVGFKA